MWEIEGDSRAWNLKFLSSFNDWESDTVQQLLSLLANKKIMPQRSDKLFWKGSQQAPIKLLWNPSKVGGFTWETWWGKVLTMEQLKKRGFHLATRCPFCGKSEETLEHIMIHCLLIWDLWAIIFASFDALRGKALLGSRPP